MCVREVASTNMNTANTMVPIGVHPYSLYSGAVKYILPFDNKIYDLKTNEVLQFLSDKNIYSSKELEDIKDFNIMSYLTAMQKGYFLGFTDIFEIDKYIVLACKNIDYVFLEKEKENCTHYSYDLNVLDDSYIHFGRGNVLVFLFLHKVVYYMYS